MCVILFPVGTHATLMYYFSCYLALHFKRYWQYSIDFATGQKLRYVEVTDVKVWISKNVLLRMLDFHKSGHK